jgi:histidine triad (HIT) family protein
MTLSGSYDRNNIFARIVRGEAPSYKVYEDEQTLAFLDLFPQARGHTLVIPKHSHARNLLEVEAPTLTQLVLTTQRVARAVAAALNPDGIQVLQFNGAPAGQTVFHLHFHVVPRWIGERTGLHAQQRGDDAELAEVARVIIAGFGATM